jgi:hypothetical protein
VILDCRVRQSALPGPKDIPITIKNQNSKIENH